MEHSLTEACEEIIDDVAIKFAEFIRKEKFYVYKDGKWYSSSYIRNYHGKQNYYTEKELFTYFKENVYGK